jgi:DNA repair protein RecO
MTLEKTKAFILKTFPYKESSLIIYLFTETHGHIHCIVKGVRKQKSRNTLIERGQLIEVNVYHRQNRNLLTAASIHVLEYFPDVRSNILKYTLRDVAFETILTAITQPETHIELFDFFLKFLYHLNNSPEKLCYPFALWLFFHRFTQYMGFGINLDCCISCGKDFYQYASLSIPGGGLECKSCREIKTENESIPESVISYLLRGRPKPEQVLHSLNHKRTKYITRVMSDYCRYHFGVQKEYKSLIFLNDLF